MKGRFNDSPAYVVDKYGQREMRSGRDLHESDCLYRTHNGKCDCALGTTINDAATRMRDFCVEKVREMRDGWQQKLDQAEEYSAVETVMSSRTYASDQIITALQSLTLEGEQKQ